MKTRQILINETRALIAKISSPLSQDEISSGWTSGSQNAANNFLNATLNALAAHQHIKNLDIGRALDHWGVCSGVLLNDLCKLTNAIRESQREFNF